MFDVICFRQQYNNLPVVDFIVTRGDDEEVLGTVIFEVTVRFLVSVGTVDADEVLGDADWVAVDNVAAVEIPVALGCIAVTKRKKNQNQRIRNNSS